MDFSIRPPEPDVVPKPDRRPKRKNRGHAQLQTEHAAESADRDEFARVRVSHGGDEEGVGQALDVTI